MRKIMRTKSGRAIRELRKIIGRTQSEFAAMIGASKDAVVSWEVGRNKVSESFARRIAFATGVDEAALLRRGVLRTGLGALEAHSPYTRAWFEQHRATYWGRSDQGAARQHLRNCADALGLLFLAATGAQGKVRDRLPALVDSFVQWCERTRADFKLEGQIREQLGRRKAKLVINHTYREWRRMQKEDPAACRVMGFKDDSRKGDGENLRLETETVPMWRPGYPMRGGV
jgi:transcriptional regulator with XRE-family HTH domain